jgi:hypothetical protein
VFLSLLEWYIRIDAYNAISGRLKKSLLSATSGLPIDNSNLSRCTYVNNYCYTGEERVAHEGHFGVNNCQARVCVNKRLPTMS